MRIHFLSHRLFSLPALLLCWGTSIAWGGADTENEAIVLLTGQPEQSFSTGRFPRPTSKIAENVTVITSADIARLNAHTLADVLQTVTGIQLDYHRSPGSFSYFNLQGAYASQVLVLMDGIPRNDFNANQTDSGKIPVQQIERVEIIKGPASAAWGQALGGVINIITKSPNPERPTEGMVSGSIGERFTTDSRGELTGTIKSFGYYLSAGNLHSDGLLPNNGTNQNNLYGKLTYLLPGNGQIMFGYSYMGAIGGMDGGYVDRWNLFAADNEKKRSNFGFLKLAQPLSERLSLEVSGYTTSRDDHTQLGEIQQDQRIASSDSFNRESSRGLSARLTWGDSSNNLTSGLEYEHGEAKNGDALIPGPLTYDRTWDRWALYGNGTVSLGPLTILPGIRIDHTGLSSDYLSYTLGATYRIGDSTVLRAYGGQGYSLANLIFKNGLQKVRTIQGGVETGAVPYLWLKGTYFYNILKGVEYTYDGSIHNQIKQGVELEARTVPLYDFALTVGYTYLYANDKDSGTQLQTNSGQTVPPQLVKVALNYNNSRIGLRGALTGNYVWWNADTSVKASNKPMIWDMHLTWQILPGKELSPEMFFSIHNLFNGVQSVDTEAYKNTPRWLEGGLRLRF